MRAIQFGDNAAKKRGRSAIRKQLYLLCLGGEESNPPLSIRSCGLPARAALYYRMQAARAKLDEQAGVNVLVDQRKQEPGP